MAGLVLEWLRTRVLTAAAGPWSNLSERLTNASLLAEFYLWEVQIEDAVYLEMAGIYDEINELRSFIFVRQPRSLTGHLSGLCSFGAHKPPSLSSKNGSWCARKDALRLLVRGADRHTYQK